MHTGALRTLRARYVVAADGARSAVRRALGISLVGPEDLMEGFRSFSSTAQVAERWRSGCVFLTGDAAHRVTPRGGTGLNLALHDGYDLGWRLAWVLRGWTPPALLDA